MYSVHLFSVPLLICLYLALTARCGYSQAADRMGQKTNQRIGGDARTVFRDDTDLFSPLLPLPHCQPVCCFTWNFRSFTPTSYSTYLQKIDYTCTSTANIVGEYVRIAPIIWTDKTTERPVTLYSIHCKKSNSNFRDIT